MIPGGLTLEEALEEAWHRADLIGRQPTPSEIAWWLARASPQSYRKSNQTY